MMWLFAAILASGIFGVVLQNYLPRRMTELVPHETIFEQIPTVVRGLRIEADERVEFITADLGLEEIADTAPQRSIPWHLKSREQQTGQMVGRRDHGPGTQPDDGGRQAGLRRRP